MIFIIFPIYGKKYKELTFLLIIHHKDRHIMNKYLFPFAEFLFASSYFRHSMILILLPVLIQSLFRSSAWSLLLLVLHWWLGTSTKPGSLTSGQSGSGYCARWNIFSQTSEMFLTLSGGLIGHVRVSAPLSQQGEPLSNLIDQRRLSDFLEQLAVIWNMRMYWAFRCIDYIQPPVERVSKQKLLLEFASTAGLLFGCTCLDWD